MGPLLPRPIWISLACLALVALLPATAEAGSRMFAPSSPWNTPLPTASKIDASSAARVGELARTVQAKQAGGLFPNIASKTYSTPIYRVGPDTPRVKVTLSTGFWGDALRRSLAGGVPIPAGAIAAKGTDAHLTVYQASTDTLWEFWRARPTAGGWTAAWGGVMERVSSNPGYYTNRAVQGLSPAQGWNWGSTASSLPVAAGTVTRAELRRGRIDHALAVAVPDACKGQFAWPAQRTDGSSTSANCMPQGARLRLDPSLDVSRLGLPRTTQILARAAQRYGMVVRDRTHGSVSLYFESPAAGQPAMDGGAPGWKLMERFPWRKLQLQQMTLCRQAPCEPAP